LSLYRNNQNPPDIMTVASSTNIMGYDEEFIHRRRSIMYIMSNKDSRIDSLETPCLIVPQLDNKNSEQHYMILF